ncbi:hypothetical protein PB2503_04107 [Parvularcula bermudensis HTCC2503]|uniref:Uncharacterized protein n=2 Tax=Parvularcula TaxID=208215 RepID=E0TEL3_PARBH|nr:hypothetical protein PB2503_04107 [Parvularcula bermudensis HTCC2503]
MGEALVQEIVMVFLTPLGLGLLTLAVAAIAGLLLWAFWEREGDAQSGDQARRLTVNTARPPMLDQALFEGGKAETASAAAPAPVTPTVRILILVVLAFFGFIIAARVLLSGQPVVTTGPVTPPGPIAEVEEPQPPTVRGSGVSCASEGPITIGRGPMTAEGQPRTIQTGDASQLVGWRVCSGSVLAAFYPLAFERDQQIIDPPIWQAGEGPLLTSENKTVAEHLYPLDWEEIDLILPAGASRDDFDAFVALGLSGFDVDTTVAQRRAATRSLGLGRFVLDELRAETGERDCTHKADVYAGSIGQYSVGRGVFGVAEDTATAPMKVFSQNLPSPTAFKPPQPVLYGVIYEAVAPGQSADLKMLVDLFLGSNGSGRTAYVDLRHFQPLRHLFTEEACPNHQLR